MGHGEALVGVDGLPGPKLAGDGIPGVLLAAAAVTVVPVAVAPAAGVEGAGHGVLVALHHVVLGTPDVVPVVGVAVVVSVPGVVARHVHEVGGGVAVARHVAHVQLVGEVLVSEGELENS